MWRIRLHLSSSKLFARPLLPQPSQFPVNPLHKLFLPPTQDTSSPVFSPSLSLPYPPTPQPPGSFNRAQGRQTWAIYLFLCAPSLRAWIGFKLLVYCGGAHIPGCCVSNRSWLWQKLRGYDFKYSFSKVCGVSSDNDIVSNSIYFPRCVFAYFQNSTETWRREHIAAVHIWCFSRDRASDCECSLGPMCMLWIHWRQ